MLHGGFGEVEHRMDIDHEGMLLFVIGNIFDGLEAGLVRGVVDQDIDAAQFFHTPIDDGAAMLGRADIACDQHRLASGVFDQAPRFLGVLLFLQIGDQHVRALACEGDRDRPSNAAIGAGDDGFQSLELRLFGALC